MRVVWGHKDYKHPYGERNRLILWCASVTSWIVYAPHITRVLYIDPYEGYSFLSKYDLLSLWDHVEIVDFDKNLKEIRQYGSPKIWTWALQEEPFWGVDWDSYLISPIPQDFDYTQFAGDTYSLTTESPFQKRLDFSKVVKFRNLPGVRKLNAELAVNSGFFFVPKPEVLSVVCLAILENIREIGKDLIVPFREWAQEIPLVNFLGRVGQEVQVIRANGSKSFFRHEFGERKTKENLLETVISSLKYDPIKLAEELGAFGTDSAKTVKDNLFKEKIN